MSLSSPAFRRPCQDLWADEDSVSHPEPGSLWTRCSHGPTCAGPPPPPAPSAAPALSSTSGNKQLKLITLNQIRELNGVDTEHPGSIWVRKHFPGCSSMWSFPQACFLSTDFCFDIFHISCIYFLIKSRHESEGLDPSDLWKKSWVNESRSLRPQIRKSETEIKQNGSFSLHMLSTPSSANTYDANT